MALPRAFVSFDFDHDEVWRNLFAGQAKSDSPTPFAVADWSSKSALPQSMWQSEIKKKIAMCHLMVVLVGPHTSTASGVAIEIGLANELFVPYFGVYVDSATTSTALPSGLARNSVVPWRWDQIANMINQCMQMGRNR